jgi:hypothetical protein
MATTNNNIVVINGKEYKVKQTMRSIMLFEEMTGKSIGSMDAGKINDVLVMLYCTLKACNKAEFENIDFDAFVDMVDENPAIIQDMSEAIAGNKKKGKK